jgi:regulator of protease activity HflC (stomatin/prohibitin superfamily)
VKQYERLVVLKWGRLENISPPGFRFLIPIIYTGRSVDLREQVVRVPTQKYITRDNVVVDMDFVLYYRVMADQAEKSVLEVADHHAAVRNLAVGELRSIVGNFTLGDALSERERMQSQLQVALDENTGRWGVKVLGAAINEIDPPSGVKGAMEREKSAAAIKTAEITESEGQRQAQINRAEGEKQAAILQAEGRRQAAILEAEGDQQAQVLRAQGFQFRPGADLPGGQHRGCEDHEPPVLRYLEVPGGQPFHQVHFPHGVHLHALAFPGNGCWQPPAR